MTPPIDEHDTDDQIQNVLAVGATPDHVFVLLTIYEQSNALNPSGQLYRTTREREADSDLLISANDALSCLWVSPAGQLWLGSSNGNLYTTAAVAFPPHRDAALDVDIATPGFNWRITTLPPLRANGRTAQVQALWGSGDGDVFAGTAEGALFHWNGSAWTEQDSPVHTELVMLHGTAPDDVYAVGEQGAILHYDGSAWRRLAVTPALGSDLVSAVWAASRDEAWVCTVQGRVLKGNRNGFTVVSQQHGAAWYGIAPAGGALVLANASGGAWTLAPGGAPVLLKGGFNPVALFDAGDRLYFIETDQPDPAVIEYAPGQRAPWGRRYL